MGAATVGDVWVLLVVTFLRRTPRCTMEDRVGALWPIEEIGPWKQVDRPATPANQWRNIVNLQKEYKGKLPMEVILRK